MPLRLAMTVYSLRLSIAPGGSGTLLPPPPGSDTLLATDLGELLALDDGSPIAVETADGR